MRRPPRRQTLAIQRCWLTLASENKIDEISRKIDAICKLFDNEQGIPTPQGSSVRNPTPAATPASAKAQYAAAVEHQRDEEAQSREPEYEGSSGLSAHTAFATKFLQSAVHRDPSTPIPPETASVLHELSITAAGQVDQGESLREQLPNAALSSRSLETSEVPLPSAQVVFAAMRIARGESSLHSRGAAAGGGVLLTTSRECPGPLRVGVRV